MKPPVSTMTPAQERAWLQGKRIRPPEPPNGHGYDGYNTFGCRCRVCTEATRLVHRKQMDGHLGISKRPRAALA